MSRESSYLSELERIANEHGGILRPSDVVDFARNPGTLLHSRFEWDDSAAAQRYREDQARGLIRVAVKMIGNGSTRAIRAFVSLSTDRHEGGYRSTISVLSDETMKARLLEDALLELDSFRAKYAEIVELGKVFDAIEAIQGAKQSSRGKKRRAA